MKNKWFFSIAAVMSIVLSLPVYSQAGLRETVEAAVVDGTIGEAEYSYSASFDRDRLELHLNWSGNILSVGLVGQTNGWIGVGFNSLQMDKALILIGYVTDGEVSFRVDLGQNHRHGETDGVEIADYSLSEEGKRTILEVALLAADFIPAGGSELLTILAYGGKDDFRSIHRFRGAFSVPLL